MKTSFILSLTVHVIVLIETGKSSVSIGRFLADAEYLDHVYYKRHPGQVLIATLDQRLIDAQLTLPQHSINIAVDSQSTVN